MLPIFPPNQRNMLYLIYFLVLLMTTNAFLPRDFTHHFVVPDHPPSHHQRTSPTTTTRHTSKPTESTGAPSTSSENEGEANRAYIEGLMDNLTAALDKWILTGNPGTKQRAYNVLSQIQRFSKDKELVRRAERLLLRAGLPKEEQRPVVELGANRRREDVEQRKDWEASRSNTTNEEVIGTKQRGEGVRSALGKRSSSSQNPDILLGQVDPRLETAPKGKVELEAEMKQNNGVKNIVNVEGNENAAARVSELIAKAGSGDAFDPDTMGIGGLDDVLAQVRRRIWIPLAAPPQLLQELGINPVRGLLLYGRPGCGKTLLARSLGKILSPLRPITVVSGPEVLDKFVGSSEKNLRELFDNPPDIYDSFRIGEADSGNAVASAALHIIVMDEFDAIARSRGGRDGGGDQGDAGVARDSVVNQLLSKMDGVDKPVVPTLVIGLTNKRSLIEPALLRPGRFEVQIEVPPPRNSEQRISILKVHTSHMFKAGRLLVSDSPTGAAAAVLTSGNTDEDLPSYSELLAVLAEKCDGYSGAALAGVARAAASHALERAVEDFASETSRSADRSLLDECVVTMADFEDAVSDLNEGFGSSDWTDDNEALVTTNEETDEESSSSSQDEKHHHFRLFSFLHSELFQNRDCSIKNCDCSIKNFRIFNLLAYPFEAMKVKPDISQVLGKAALMLDSLVSPHPPEESMAHRDSHSGISLDEANDRRYSGGSMDEIMGALLSETGTVEISRKNTKESTSTDDLN